MNTITLRIDYAGEVTLNGEYTATAPFTMTWFRDVDLVLETTHERKVFNGATDAVITLKTPSRELEIIEGVKLQIAKNEMCRYVIINDKYAVKIPNGVNI